MKSKNDAPARQVAKFRELARRVVSHHFGTRPARLKYKSAGLSNFVFEARHPEGDFIVRISPDKARLNTFIKEHWAADAARKAGVPVAEILETGYSTIPYPYAVSRRLAGIEALIHPERHKIVREMGRLAAKINSIRTHGFGETFDWSNNRLSRNETFEAYLAGEYDSAAKLETIRRSKLCPDETLKILKRTMREMTKLRTRPVLNHGDLRLKNMIADEEGRIVAILDWEKATSNVAPHWEFSTALHDLGIDEQQHFIEGYGISPKHLSDITPFIKAFSLLNYAAEIDRATRERDKITLGRLRQRFDGTFDLFTLK